MSTVGSTHVPGEEAGQRNRTLLSRILSFLFFSGSSQAKRHQTETHSDISIAVPQLNLSSLDREHPRPSGSCRESPQEAASRQGAGEGSEPGNLQQPEESFRLPRVSFCRKLKGKIQRKSQDYSLTKAKTHTHSERLIFCTVYYNYFCCL